ncbi:MAG: phosphate uptake regulator PhoU [Actinobacteria bacterium]|nr:phosphate uptake regulator PhoU [Actinomycetota bacterium]MCL5446457.1 phosphate uptake regulator PhoU [Actinomycetota bacterium]
MDTFRVAEAGGQAGNAGTHPGPVDSTGEAALSEKPGRSWVPATPPVVAPQAGSMGLEGSLQPSQPRISMEHASVEHTPIERTVVRLFALVGEGLAGATHSLLAGDREAARTLADHDEEVDALYSDVERLVYDRMAVEHLDQADLRYLVVLLRILPEIERSGDLAEHIARRAVRGLGMELSHRARGLVERMGEVASDMWRAATDAFVDRNPLGGDIVEDLDDEMDELHVTLTAEIASGSMPLPVAIEAALVARFYERFGDHAVNLARRVEAISVPKHP